MYSSANGWIACETGLLLFCLSGLNICFYTPIQMLMSASITMEVANTTVMTQIQVTHVPAIMATFLTVMDIHVKVGKR